MTRGRKKNEKGRGRKEWKLVRKGRKWGRKWEGELLRTIYTPLKRDRLEIDSSNFNFNFLIVEFVLNIFFSEQVCRQARCPR